MRLKKRKINKQAVALAIAASVAVSVPMSANAVTYKISDGGGSTVHVDKDDNGNTVSWQDNNNNKDERGETIGGTSKENAYSHAKDNELNIEGDGNSETTDTTDTILDVEKNTDASDVKITISGVNADISNDGNEDTDDSAIQIGNGSKANITVSDTTIDSNVEDEGVIDIGKNSEVDLTIKDSTITMGQVDEGENVKNDQTGIRVDYGSDVTINVEGDNTITTASDSTVDSIVDGSAHRIINGIVVGGNGEDSVGGPNSDSETKGETTVTITSDATKEDGSGASLTIYGTTTGITVHTKSQLIIDGNGKNDKLKDDDDDKADKKALKLNIENTVKSKEFKSSKTGRGIVSYGGSKDDDGNQTTGVVIKDNAQVTIDNSSYVGMDLHGTGIEITDGADVDVNKDDTTGTAGIHLQGVDDTSGLTPNMTVDGEGTTLTINGSGSDGTLCVAADNAEVKFLNGAKVDMSNLNITRNADGTIASQTCKGGAGINFYDTNNSKLTITGKGTELTLHDIGDYQFGHIYFGGVGNKFELSDNASAFDDSSAATFAFLAGKQNVLLVDNAKLESDVSDRTYPFGRLVIRGQNNEDEENAFVIQNGGKVRTAYIYDDKANAGATKYKFYITGGTLTLTSNAMKSRIGGFWSANPLCGIDMQVPYVGQDKYNTYMLWPTNGDEYGNEKLTGFRLNAAKLIENAANATTYHILYDESGKPKTLVFDVLGWKGDTSVPYATEVTDKDGNTYKGYVVDLSKYDLTEETTLDVWVPAVVVKYYYQEDLEKGNIPDYNGIESTLYSEIEDSRYISENIKALLGLDIEKLSDIDDPVKVSDAQVVEALAKIWGGVRRPWQSTWNSYKNNISTNEQRELLKQYIGTDIVIRGQNIDFATLTEGKTMTVTVTNDDGTTKEVTGDIFTTHNTDDTSKKWYIFGDDGNAYEFTSSTVITAQSETNIYATKHFHEWTLTEETDPDCKIPGTRTYTCECGETKTEEIPLSEKPLIDHLWRDEWELVSETPATYETEGKRVYVNRCDRYPSEHLRYKEEIISKLEKPAEPDEPVIPKPDNRPKGDDDKDNKKNTDDSVPVVPAVVPVTPETPVVTPEAPVVTPETPAAEPVAETPATPAPAETAPAAPVTNKLPQTGAALFESIGLAAAGLALSLGSLFGKGKHERK